MVCFKLNWEKLSLKRIYYLDVVIIGAEDVENDAPLMASSRAVAAHDTLAHANTLVGHDEFIENVLTVSDTVFDDALVNRVTALNETVKDGNAVGQARTAYCDGVWVHSVLDGSFQDSETHILGKQVSELAIILNNLLGNISNLRDNNGDVFSEMCPDSLLQER